HTVGVVVPDLTNPMFPPMFRGIEDRLQQIGYSALLTNSDFNLEREWQLLEMFIKRQVDGLILATARLDDPIVKMARERGMTVVLMN
ncbi:substrate-binding domain-containing protein, partial [Stenotrophomonas maltophilia]|uniref:substrate-binding domain-containing protein n=1 Tax=Stenotrophomonas maltophilia TaxID=40324 RepID=UPI0013DA5641